MSALPNNVRDTDLLRWVEAHPNEAFDPHMVINATHTTDWQWQAVDNQMKELRRKGYITMVRQAPEGSTYWTITPKGQNYLRASERAEKASEEEIPADRSPGDPVIASPIAIGQPTRSPSPSVIPPTIIKAFGAASIALNERAKLTFKVINPNFKVALTEIGFTDPLPAGLVVSNPNDLVGSWAEGRITADPGSDIISLSGAVLPADGACEFQLSVTGTTSGQKSNTTSAISSKEGVGGTASASLLVLPVLGTSVKTSDRLPTEEMSLAQAGYKSDDPTGEDFLDIDRDVKALASVLAAKDVDPPLSLGLFGDWGAGKSFFMRRLEKRIRELTDDAKQANGKSQYCQDVVQLTFNAWNYIDKDLWASLAAEIFEGLAAALASKRGGDSEDGRALALAAASSSPAIVAETERKKDKAVARLRESEEQLAELQRSQRNIKPRLSAREVLNHAARFAVKDEEVQKQAEKVAREIGISKETAAVGEIQTQILELKNIWTEIVFTVRNNSLWALVFASLAALGVCCLALYLAKHYITQEVVRKIVPALAAVSSFLAVFLAKSRKLVGFVRKLRASKQELIDKTQQAIKDKIEHARATVEEAAETLKTLSQQLEDMRADRQMVDFIRKRYESSDYRQNLGTIARVRADFRHLSALLRDVQTESEKDIEEIKARQTEKEKERQEKDKNTPPLFPRIDRMILYIDDLDRCQEKNVVDVLQAVHLLLAFPLFVVVVGVDPRWLLHSLRQHTAVFQGDRTSDEKAESREDLGWQSTPLNYLEKIFQIPFTLRPISRRGFERLVNAFATQRPGNNQGSLSSQKEPVLPVNESNPQAPTDQTAASSAREIIDRHPEHLRIEEWEQVFMKALYELIPSPRAAKRFINIYRLLRASVEDPERNEFVGNSTGGVYQCALMLLAILTGYPTEATEILEALLKEQPKEKNWGQFLASLREKVRHERPLTTRSISPEIPPLSRWEELLVKIERMKNNLNDRPCEGFVKWAPRVARYSFQSGRVLLRQRE